jgi:DNA uptake protein ComE-like DNA-binding protein
MQESPNQVDTAWVAAVKRSEIKTQDSSDDHYQKNDNENAYAYQYDKRKSSYTENNIIKGELFYIDPNTITGSQWKILELRDKTIKTIENYRSKGGHFYKPGDLQRIYGLHDDEYERLRPYIKIESTLQKTNENLFRQNQKMKYNHKTYAALFYH